eukprot:m.90893 g.90893  ORF g.90893 m.90893 type:complete len:333 (-) comp8481_c0_seq4:2460-3458(-)
MFSRGPTAPAGHARVAESLGPSADRIHPVPHTQPSLAESNAIPSEELSAASGSRAGLTVPIPQDSKSPMILEAARPLQPPLVMAALPARALAVLALVTLALIPCIVVAYAARDAEDSRFETRFTSVTMRLQTGMQNQLERASTLALSMTTLLSLSAPPGPTNGTWHVVKPATAEALAVMPAAPLLAWAPLVPASKRASFEAFVRAQVPDILADIANKTCNLTEIAARARDGITGREISPRPVYYPVWQTVPACASGELLLFDLASSGILATAIEHALLTSSPTLSGFFNSTSLPLASVVSSAVVVMLSHNTSEDLAVTADPNVIGASLVLLD